MRSEVRILSGAMFIKTFTSGPVATNSYLVGCPETHEAIVIDAPQGVASEIVSERKWSVKAIFITHSHWDHIADAAKLKEMLQVPLYVHLNDAENLKQPGSDRLPMFFSIDPVIADGSLKEGEIFHIGKLEFQVIETPGHSPGGVCLWFPKEKVLFSGDTLFKGSMGRVNFPTSSPSQMWESLNKLAKLPPDTQVYPGHGPATTIAEEGWITRAKIIFGG
jgi:hydroxyacylglutathione hydrolase